MIRWQSYLTPSLHFCDMRLSYHLFIICDLKNALMEYKIHCRPVAWFWGNCTFWWVHYRVRSPLSACVLLCRTNKPSFLSGFYRSIVLCRKQGGKYNILELLHMHFSPFRAFWVDPAEDKNLKCVSDHERLCFTLQCFRKWHYHPLRSIGHYCFSGLNIFKR